MNYKTYSNHSREHMINVRDLGVIMLELIFKDYNDVTITTTRTIIGWIIRTFKTRNAMPLMLLF